MVRRPALLAASIVLASACAGAQGPGEDPRRQASAAAVCPEYAELRCATPRECSLDRSRGCLVCRCGAPAVAPWPSGALPSAVPPDRRAPQ